MDQDLHALTANYLNDQINIMRRAGRKVNLSPEQYSLLIRRIGAIGQELREDQGFFYEPTEKPDAI